MKTMRSLKWLRPLLVVLFMSYYVGGTAFTHTHHFLNSSITHSHPYLPGADGLPHHEHSTVAFNTIEELTELCLELIPHFYFSVRLARSTISSLLPRGSGEELKEGRGGVQTISQKRGQPRFALH